MWDLTGTQFSRGVLELRLEKSARGLLRFPIWLGPIRGRLVAICLLLLTGYLHYFRQPYRYFVNNGWMNPEEATRALQIQTYVLGGLALLLHLSVFFLRRERLSVEFDRHSKSMRWMLGSMGARSTAQEGEVPFSMFDRIEVQGASAKARAPHGTMEVSFKAQARPPFKALKMRFLSDEQKKIYPLNLYRISEVKPVGDWTDPDDEPLGGDPKPEGF